MWLLLNDPLNDVDDTPPPPPPLYNCLYRKEIMRLRQIVAATAPGALHDDRPSRSGGDSRGAYNPNPAVGWGGGGGGGGGY